MDNTIPLWLQWSKEPKLQSNSDLLTESRQEMYEALKLFHNHVKYIIYILVSIIAAPLLIMRIIPSLNDIHFFYIVVGLILALLPPILGILSIQIILKYYQVYISALVFMVRVHIGAGLTHAHPWIERTIQQAIDVSNKVESSKEFLKYRAKSKKDTFFYYKWIIRIISFTSLLCGIVLLLRGIDSSQTILG